MIKNVIFDLSEVLLPGMIGVELHLEAATGIPRDRITRAMGIHPHYTVRNILDDLLKGTLSYEQYRRHVLQEIGLADSSSGLFDRHCLDMFAEPYEFTEELLAAVALECDLFLLSDHCQTWASYICGRHSFMNRFKDIVWSYETGATKREPKPFEYILSRNNLAPESTLFVDDLGRNIEMAQRFGLATVHFKGRESVQEIYDSIKEANRTPGRTK